MGNVTELDSPTPSGEDTVFSMDSHSSLATLPTFGDVSSAASESESIVVGVSGSDTGSGSESTGSVSVAVSSSDTASLSGETDDFEFGAEGLDTASASESYSIAVPIFDEEAVVASMAVTWFRSALSISEAVKRYFEPMQHAASAISARFHELTLEANARAM